MERHFCESKSSREEINQYSQSALPFNCLKKTQAKILSPAIFAEKKDSLDVRDKNSMILEHLLAITVQTYYKSSFELNKIILQLQQNFLDSQSSSKSSLKRRKPGAPEQNSQITYKNDFSQRKRLIDKKNNMDYLLSPLKKDFEFGRLTRTLEHQGHRNLRIGNLLIR